LKILTMIFRFTDQQWRDMLAAQGLNASEVSNEDAVAFLKDYKRDIVDERTLAGWDVYVTDGAL
jgi:hypothetical protein